MERNVFKKVLECKIRDFSSFLEECNSRRLQLLEGKTEYSPSREDFEITYFKGWYSLCHSTLAMIGSFEKDGHKIGNADEFRKCVETCRGIIKPDSEYFTELHDLRDAAIDEDNAGRTLPLE